MKNKKFIKKSNFIDIFLKNRKCMKNLSDNDAYAGDIQFSRRYNEQILFGFE